MSTHEKDQAQLRKLAEYLDSKYQLPFGIKIGWDAILGLIPGIGDTLTSVVSFYLIYRAAVLGCPPAVILRMCLNLLIENAVAVIPIVGNIFDIFWKANNRNVGLMNTYLSHPARTQNISRLVVALSLAILLSVIIACFAMMFLAIKWLWEVLVAL